MPAWTSITAAQPDESEAEVPSVPEVHPDDAHHAELAAEMVAALGAFEPEVAAAERAAAEKAAAENRLPQQGPLAEQAAAETSGRRAGRHR
jgi:chemosensory pili system protein ChpA (sensor histidine kinase/response regulator)